MTKRIICAALALLVLAAGCGRRDESFEVRKRPAKVADLIQLMREAKKDPPPAILPERYEAERSARIESLVEAGSAAGANSSSLSKALKIVTPSKSKNHVIPTRVILSTFNGRPAWIVVQNWSKAGKELTHARVWVIDTKNQSLLYAASQQ